MRKLHIITAGKADRPLQILIDEYQKRLSRYFDIEWQIVKTGDKKTENDFFRAALDGKKFIALDETGRDISSMELAAYLEQTASNGQPDLNILIGGSYGIDEAILGQAETTWRFGRITLPHQLARLLLVEQLYRASSINHGSAYHHE